MLLGQPWHRIWGLDAARAPVTTFTIGIDTAEVVREKTKEAAGFRMLKVKLGKDNDREMIETIRSLTDVPLTADPNQGWQDRQYAIDMAHWLKEQGVLYIEQPMPKDRLDDLAWLAANSPLPILGDEGVQRLPDLIKAHERGTYNGVVLKLMKTTGMREAFTILVGENLLVRVPNRGVSVARPGADDVREIHRVRLALETSALRWSDPVPQPGLHAAVEDGRAARDRRDVTGMADANQRFHRGVVELAGSARQNELMSRTLAEMRQDLFPSMANERLQGGERDGTWLRPKLLRNDQSQRDVGLVFLGGVVDDLHVLPVADHLRDLQEGDVAAALGVVELTIRIALDDAPLRGRRFAISPCFAIHCL